MSRRTWLRGIAALLASATFLIAGCASLTGEKATFPSETQWNGRLALKVHSTPPQAFSADFELIGNPQTGSLVFYSPLGTTALQLQWAPGSATLTGGGETRQFASLAALAQQATGTELPLQVLFDWLQGRATGLPGWSVDLSALESGRLQAERLGAGLPRVELRIALQR